MYTNQDKMNEKQCRILTAIMIWRQWSYESVWVWDVVLWQVWNKTKNLQWWVAQWLLKSDWWIIKKTYLRLVMHVYFPSETNYKLMQKNSFTRNAHLSMPTAIVSWNPTLTTAPQSNLAAWTSIQHISTPPSQPLLNYLCWKGQNNLLLLHLELDY